MGAQGVFAKVAPSTLPRAHHHYTEMSAEACHVSRHQCARASEESLADTWKDKCTPDSEECCPAALPMLCGSLLKQCPVLNLKYQERYVEVRDGRLYWWDTEGAKYSGDGEPKGCIDFRSNPCCIVVDA